MNLFKIAICHNRTIREIAAPKQSSETFIEIHLIIVFKDFNRLRKIVMN